jgi:hypothetical protein
MYSMHANPKQKKKKDKKKKENLKKKKIILGKRFSFQRKMHSCMML